MARRGWVGDDLGGERERRCGPFSRALVMLSSICLVLSTVAPHAASASAREREADLVAEAARLHEQASRERAEAESERLASEAQAQFDRLVADQEEALRAAHEQSLDQIAASDAVPVDIVGDHDFSVIAERMVIAASASSGSAVRN